MAGRWRQRRRRGRLWPAALLVGIAAITLWWLVPDSLHIGNFHANLALTPDSSASAGERRIHEPEPTPPSAPTHEPAGNSSTVEAKTAQPPATASKPAVSSNPEPSESTPPLGKPNPVKSADVSHLISVAKEALTKEDWLTARTNFNQAMSSSTDGAERETIRTELNRIGAETIFSNRIIDGDPLVDRYTIHIGDNLAKIASNYKVSPDLLARINRLADKNHIREGQSLKVIRGPFRAVVTKSAYTLDLYLGDALVASFKVGLGAEDSTPTGEWRVGTKLVNPTYYPPRGGGIIAADDPKNPLGERWIALVGISGPAVGQERYGIHGTSEPDSIGKSMSMGCIRMRNEDVEQVYDYLVENHSTVTVR